MKKSTFNYCQNLVRLSSTCLKKSKRNFHFFLCIERQPVITHPLINLEKKFKETLTDLEYTHSLKSNFELTKEKEEAQKMKVNKDAKHSEDLEEFKYTIQDVEEKYQENLKNLVVAPREQNKEIEENLSSTKRLLNNSLFLVKKQKDESGKEIWLPPKDIVSEGESLKEAIKRLIEQCCGTDSVTNLYSTVPLGFVQERSKDINKNDSQKIFYFLVKYLKGLQNFNTEYQWLSSQELKKVLPDSIYQDMNHLFITSK